ncbi:hypothetical protein EVG80_15390 [Salmonella enterica subsp. enterica serovar Mississippi]|nr:hypothetical protein [Salmonella enterica subsp. enterica serovar Mississippi]
MPVYANSDGVATGKFRIPKSKFKAGTKQVLFKGTGGSKSYAETTFTGQGTVVTNAMRQVKNVMQSYYDPLAQTFMLNEPRQLHAVDVWVTTRGNTPLIVQLRETSTGFPTREIVAEGRIDPALVTVGGWTTIAFDIPFYAAANIEYAVVVLANDALTEVAISELGKRDLSTNTYVTTQPYQVGVLLSSANASTWTAHQDRDLTFRLRARRYTAPSVTVPLGSITLPAGTTDLLISAMTSTPATGADAELQLITTDPNNPTQKTVRTVSDGQVVKFDVPVSGPMDVTAVLRSTATASATIAPGTQIIAGEMASTGTYVTLDIPVNATGTSTMVVTLEALSLATTPKVEYAESVANSNTYNWVAVPYVKPATGIDKVLANGRTELTYKTAANGVPAMAKMKLRITLDGSPAMRPEIFNLRASIV